MSIILVRHGETELNAARVMQPADTGLSERGLRQAEAVAQRLGAAAPRGIVSSDLPRAWLTAQAIAERARLPVRADAQLQERNFGALRGRRYDSLGFDPLTMAEAPPDGESAAEFARRVHSAFDRMLALHADLRGDLVVVTHGLFIRVLLAGPLQLPAARLDGLHLGNTCVSIFDAQPPHALSLLNCTRHLGADLGGEPNSLSGG